MNKLQSLLQRARSAGSALVGISRDGQREGWFFPSARASSGHIELGALQRKFRTIARALGIPDQMKLYCARHTLGTVTMAEAKDPFLVRETMGHSDLKTPMVYMHPDVSRIKDIIDSRNESKLLQ